MGNKNVTNQMAPYYESTIRPLKKIIKLQSGRKVVNVYARKRHMYYSYIFEQQRKGVIIKFDNDDTYELSCDSIEAGVIMFYYDIEDSEYTKYINDDFRKYIKKTVKN
jgi:hypothetical protein